MLQQVAIRSKDPEEFARNNGHFNDDGYEYVAGEFEEPDYTGRTMKQIETYRKNMTFLNRIRPKNYRGKVKARNAAGLAYLEIADDIKDNPKYNAQQNQRYRANKARILAIKRQCERDEQTKKELLARGESVEQEEWKDPQKQKVQTIDVNKLGKQEDRVPPVTTEATEPEPTQNNESTSISKTEDAEEVKHYGSITTANGTSSPTRTENNQVVTKHYGAPTPPPATESHFAASAYTPVRTSDTTGSPSESTEVLVPLGRITSTSELPVLEKQPEEKTTIQQVSSPPPKQTEEPPQYNQEPKQQKEPESKTYSSSSFIVEEPAKPLETAEPTQKHEIKSFFSSQKENISENANTTFENVS